MLEIFEKAAKWLTTAKPELALEDKILSPKQLNYIRLLTKYAGNDEAALSTLEQYLNETIAAHGTENYVRNKQRIVRQLDLHPRIPSEFIEKFASKTILELYRPPPPQ